MNKVVFTTEPIDGGGIYQNCSTNDVPILEADSLEEAIETMLASLNDTVATHLLHDGRINMEIVPVTIGGHEVFTMMIEFLNEYKSGL